MIAEQQVHPLHQFLLETVKKKRLQVAPNDRHTRRIPASPFEEPWPCHYSPITADNQLLQNCFEPANYCFCKPGFRFVCSHASALWPSDPRPAAGAQGSFPGSRLRPVWLYPRHAAVAVTGFKWNVLKQQKSKEVVCEVSAPLHQNWQQWNQIVARFRDVPHPAWFSSAPKFTSGWVINWPAEKQWKQHCRLILQVQACRYSRLQGTQQFHSQGNKYFVYVQDKKTTTGHSYEVTQAAVRPFAKDTNVFRLQIHVSTP